MDKPRLESYANTLEALRRELQDTLTAGAEDARPVEPDRAIGRLTRQDAMQSQQMTLELRRRNRQRLLQIERALERVEDGSFGYCLRCGEEISETRLRVRPESPICIECAENRTRI